MIALIAGPAKPPRFVQGLGLPYLAAVLEEAGLKAGIFDLYPASPDTDDPAVLDQRLADVIAREQPAIAGMTIHTPEYAARVRLAKLLRERLPETLLVAGGHHASAEPAHLLRHSDFDLCVIDEGEKTLLEIAKRTAGAARGRVNDRLRDIRGVVYKRGSQIRRTPPRPAADDTDEQPFPAHHLLGLESYTAHPHLGMKSTGLLSYRGCPMGCAFCINPQGDRVRKRSPSRVADEMERVVKEFGVRGFNLYDNLFGLRRHHALAVCEEIIRRRLDVVWDCWTAGDLVDGELAEKMRTAGCVRAGFGAESGDDTVLHKAKRGFTRDQHQAGMRALRAAGLKVEVGLMVGLPGESEASVRRTAAFPLNCGAEEVVLSVYRPWPGTAIWKHPEAFGARITRGANFEAYIETEHLSRAAILECIQRAGEELNRRGVAVNFLRCDRYAWE